MVVYSSFFQFRPEAPEERASRTHPILPRWARAAAPLARHRRVFMSGAGPSSSGGHSSASHVDGESLALMRRLQEEDDAAQLMAQEPGLQPHALGLQPRTRPAVRRVHPATLHSWRFKGVRTWLGLEPRRGALTLTLTLTFALTRCAHSRRCRAGSTAGGSGPPVGGGLEQPPAAQWTAPDCEDGELDTRCAGAQARGAPRSQHGQADRPGGASTRGHPLAREPAPEAPATPSPRSHCTTAPLHHCTAAPLHQCTRSAVQDGRQRARPAQAARLPAGEG